MEIDKTILKKTNHCIHKFECLRNEDYLHNVKVEKCLNDEIVFVNCEDTNCKYRMRCGKHTTCYCPTKKEILRSLKR